MNQTTYNGTTGQIRLLGGNRKLAETLEIFAASEIKAAWSDEAREASAEARRRGYGETRKNSQGMQMQHPDGHAVVIRPSGAWTYVPPSGRGDTARSMMKFDQMTSGKGSASFADQMAKVHGVGPANYQSNDYRKQSDEFSRQHPDIKSGLEAREFSDKKREKLAKSGAAMPGGGFPIESREDLKNAVQAIGRAKNPEATKRHIKQRAKALGATDLLPDDWKGDMAAGGPGSGRHASFGLNTKATGNKVHDVMTGLGYRKMDGVGGQHYGHDDGHTAVFHDRGGAQRSTLDVRPAGGMESREDHLSHVEMALDDAGIKG